MGNIILILSGNKFSILLRRGIRMKKTEMGVKKMGRLMELVRLIINKAYNLDRGELLVCIWKGSTIF